MFVYFKRKEKMIVENNELRRIEQEIAEQILIIMLDPDPESVYQAQGVTPLPSALETMQPWTAELFIQKVTGKYKLSCPQETVHRSLGMLYRNSPITSVRSNSLTTFGLLDPGRLLAQQLLKGRGGRVAGSPESTALNELRGRAQELYPSLRKNQMA